MTTSFETVAGLRSKLAAGDVSSVELTRDALKRISDLNPELNAVISSSEERAINAAIKADEARREGSNSPLLGIPMLHKDIFCTQGLPTTCASKMLADFVAPYDATVVTRLDQAGMVTLGKCNMDEFAMGSSNETSHFGACKNPWDISRVPGGSSGGSASAVAAGLAPIATGTDTGGSIRQPAALCGITGLKPTYGRVSRYGMIAFASSMDQAGPMARTAEDCALVLEAMAGADVLDSTCSDQEVPHYSAHLSDSVEGMRVGIPKEFFSSDLNPDVAAVIETSLKELERMGAKLVDVSLPSTSLGVSTYYIIAPAEASANLSRYDGVRYGYRCENPTDLQDLYLRSRSEGFGDEVKRRILVGAFTLSAASYDQYFMKAQQVRRLIAQEYDDVLSQVDVIAGPSAPNTAFVLNDTSKSITDMYMEDVFTIGANLAGLPAMSVPAGFLSGLPVGMQLIGRRFGEVDILKLAHQFQQRTTWHSLTPSMEERH